MNYGACTKITLDREIERGSERDKDMYRGGERDKDIKREWA